MENASKALLIAGAILIAIVLISLGVMILGQGSDLVKNTNMSDAEISTYNGEFEQFKGTNVRGNMVMQLINKINQHNRANKGDVSKQVNMVIGDSATATGQTKDLTAEVNTLKGTDIKTGFSYTVTMDYSTGGLVSIVYVKQNKNS